ncbi:hypothetical protein LC653_30595 [Nostoc sp. CHAB 5784]|uniref:hypothetical protein n=1 Tax=Nostoc mirabile TaxID=2907820 RepID=UPI001E48FE8C|nr:hypothetical protein [Nostoc mirabile]MCC5668105.1 hypothetical protein [Nostoc mirabile CHAB5784]
MIDFLHRCSSISRAIAKIFIIVLYMVSGFCFPRIFLTPKENLLKFSWLLPSFLSWFLFGSGVKVAAIANWHFDSNRNHLDFTTDENVQPKVQLLTNPR